MSRTLLVRQTSCVTGTRAPARGCPSHTTWLLRRVRVWEGHPLAGALAFDKSTLTDYYNYVYCKGHNQLRPYSAFQRNIIVFRQGQGSTPAR